MLLIWHLLSEVLLVLTAIILTEGARPAVKTLNRRHVPFGLSIAAVYAALVLVILGLVALLAGPVVRVSIMRRCSGFLRTSASGT